MRVECGEWRVESGELRVESGANAEFDFSANTIFSMQTLKIFDKTKNSGF